MASLVSPPSKTNSNISICQTFLFFHGSFPEPLHLSAFNRAEENHADSGNSCLLSVFIIILSSARQDSHTFSQAVLIKVIFRRIFWSPAPCWLRCNYSPRYSSSQLAPKWTWKSCIYTILCLSLKFIILRHSQTHKNKISIHDWRCLLTSFIDFMCSS